MELTKLTYRKALSSDLDYLLYLRKETMNEHLNNAGMYLNDDDHVARILYRYEGARIILWDSKSVGFLKTVEDKEQIEIIQIQIEPVFQGKGIGQYVVNDVIQYAVGMDLSVVLSVLKGNKARSLYERSGSKLLMKIKIHFL